MQLLTSYAQLSAAPAHWPVYEAELAKLHPAFKSVSRLRLIRIGHHLSTMVDWCCGSAFDLDPASRARPGSSNRDARHVLKDSFAPMDGRRSSNAAATAGAAARCRNRRGAFDLTELADDNRHGLGRIDEIALLNRSRCQSARLPGSHAS